MKAKPRVSSLVLPYPVLRTGRKLLDQHLWCLGCDVRQADFPLAEFGLNFLRRPNRDQGCSRLTAVLPGSGHLSLWGFGLAAYSPAHGAIWIRRKGFRPLHRKEFDPLHPCWDHRTFNTWHPPADPEAMVGSLQMLHECARWFCAYETAISKRFGDAYRSRCVSAWVHNARAIPSAEMAAAWQFIEQSLITFHPNDRSVHRTSFDPTKRFILPPVYL